MYRHITLMLTIPRIIAQPYADYEPINPLVSYEVPEAVADTHHSLPHFMSSTWIDMKQFGCQIRLLEVTTRMFSYLIGLSALPKCAHFVLIQAHKISNCCLSHLYSCPLSEHNAFITHFPFYLLPRLWPRLACDHFRPQSIRGENLLGPV